jgi:hypothetical protein
MTDHRPYGEFDELVSTLQSEGHDEVAQKLHTLLHETAWTTGSELMGELGREILAFRRNTPHMSPKLQKLVRDCLQEVERVWPHIEAV